MIAIKELSGRSDVLYKYSIFNEQKDLVYEIISNNEYVACKGTDINGYTLYTQEALDKCGKELTNLIFIKDKT